jgi:hypothetical protein
MPNENNEISLDASSYILRPYYTQLNPFVRYNSSNSYTINNTGDCSYYLLNIWKQLGYDQEHDELHLTGDNVAYRQQVQNQLKEYLRRIFIINPQAEFNTSHTSRIEDIPFDIQALLICE